ncbi:MAG: filamentous hemagglutinin, partial [Cyanobacteria bacterium J06636_27]
TASSELGASFSGTVELNTPGIDPSKAVNQLPANITDPTNQIASECSAQTGNKFVITGRGGIPQNPSDRVSKNVIWSDIRDLSTIRHKKNIVQETINSKQKVIIEATGFQFDEFGRVELVAKMAENSQKWQQMPNCGEV